MYVQLIGVVGPNKSGRADRNAFWHALPVVCELPPINSPPPPPGASKRGAKYASHLHATPNHCRRDLNAYSMSSSKNKIQIQCSLFILGYITLVP